MQVEAAQWSVACIACLPPDSDMRMQEKPYFVSRPESFLCLPRIKTPGSSAGALTSCLALCEPCSESACSFLAAASAPYGVYTCRQEAQEVHSAAKASAEIRPGRCSIRVLKYTADA